MLTRYVFALVPFGIYLAGVFCVAQPKNVPLADLDANARLEHDFTIYQPRYKEMRAARVVKVRALAVKVFREEAEGKNTACSHQILFESESLLLSSADFKFVDRRLQDLEASLAGPDMQQRALERDPQSGMWGACYKEWFLKVYASYDQLDKRAATENQQPHPLPKFLDRINTPQKLTSYLDGISISDVQSTGIDHELEFNEMLSCLTRMLIDGEPEHYVVDPQLRSTMLDFILHRFRDNETGWWGERYMRNGSVDFIDDLSITFHEISYLNGNVPAMGKVIDTLLAVKDLNYPVGWLWQNHYWNHNNMDVITLLNFGWPSASAHQRKQMAAEIMKMLDWCLHSSLQTDGSFKTVLPDGSVEDATYYGTEFLARIGFFDPSKRFWTTQTFPEAGNVRTRIATFIERHLRTAGTGGDSYRTALEDVQAPKDKTALTSPN